MPTEGQPGLYEAPDFDQPGWKAGYGGGRFTFNQPPTFSGYQTGILPEGPISSGPTSFPGFRRRFGDLPYGSGPDTQFSEPPIGTMPGAGVEQAPGAATAAPPGSLPGLGGAGAGTEGGTYAPWQRLVKQAGGDPGPPAGGGGNVWSPQQLLQILIGQAQDAGVFNPNGSPGLLRALNDEIMARNRGFTENAMMGAEAYAPDDPYLRNYARLNAGIQGQHDLSTGLANARTSSAMQNQQGLWELLMALMGRTIAKDPKSQSSVGFTLPGGFGINAKV